MKILIAYDGTVHAKNALRYGLKKAREQKGEVILLHVFDRAAFIDYEAGPKAEVMARAEAAGRLQDARKIMQENAPDVSTSVIEAEGNAEQVLTQYAEREKPDLILVPQRLRSVQRSLSQPVSVIPGIILVPVDTVAISPEHIDIIKKEAAATGSAVVLAGIVPVHLYSREERNELEQVRRETEAGLNAAAKELAGSGVETKKITRSGYPDEEILKTAEEYPVTMILIPSKGDAPSELNKAAAIILDEPERVNSPVTILPDGSAA